MAPKWAMVREWVRALVREAASAQGYSWEVGWGQAYFEAAQASPSKPLQE